MNITGEVNVRLNSPFGRLWHLIVDSFRCLSNTNIFCVYWLIILYSSCHIISIFSHGSVRPENSLNYVSGTYSTWYWKHSSQIVSHVHIKPVHGATGYTALPFNLLPKGVSVASRGQWSILNPLACRWNRLQIMCALWNGALSCTRSAATLSSAFEWCSVGFKGPKCAPGKHSPHRVTPAPTQGRRTAPQIHAIRGKSRSFHLHTAAEISSQNQESLWDFQPLQLAPITIKLLNTKKTF